MNNNKILKRNISNKQPKPTSRITNKQTKLRVARRKEINKIRVELNNIETKKRFLRINKCRRWFFEKTKLTEFKHQEKKREDPKNQNQN